MIKRLHFQRFFVLLIKPFRFIAMWFSPKWKQGKFFIGKMLKSLIFCGPRGKVRWMFVGILVLAVYAGLLDSPKYYDKGIDWMNKGFKQYKYLDQVELDHFKNLPFHLGLDLRGGTHLVYNADVSQIEEKEQDEALEGVRDVIERRVNALGVAEPIVQTTKSGENWRVVVELAGVKDVNQAIQMIGETPFLEFREPNEETERGLTQEEQDELNTYNIQAKLKAQDILKKIQEGANFEELAVQYSEAKPDASSGGTTAFFVSKSGRYADLFIEAERIGAGKISDAVFENADGFYILKVHNKNESEKEVQANHLLICYKGADRCESDRSEEEALVKIKELKAQATPDNFIELVKQNSTEPGANTTAGDLGWFEKGMMVQEFEDAIFSMNTGEISEPVKTQFGYHLIYKKDERPLVEYEINQIFLKKKKPTDILPPPDPWKAASLTGKQLKRSSVQFDPNTGQAQVGLEFNDEGKKLFAEITERNIGKPVAIFLDGAIISQPTVQEKIGDGRAVISGNFSLDEAKLLTQRLNAGALPVPVTLVNQQTVGATLGGESVKQSLNAALLGFLAVSLFMILFYRLPGFLSVLSLGVYALLLLAIFKTIPVTLTLAGIAGFILSLGMAVDANVLVFERLREEIGMGKTLGSAIDESFVRAWPSIRDGNASTLITCVVLATFGTSLIKGFAITLGLGVLVSMLSAIIVTKTFLKLVSVWIRVEWVYGRKNLKA